MASWKIQLLLTTFEMQCRYKHNKFPCYCQVCYKNDKHEYDTTHCRAVISWLQVTSHKCYSPPPLPPPQNVFLFRCLMQDKSNI